MVFIKPSSNETSGVHPKVDFAFLFSAFILQISVGLFGSAPIDNLDEDLVKVWIFYLK